MGGFAKIRDGLKEHMSVIPPMEAKIYFIQHLEARRTGPGRGKVFSNISKLAEIAGHKRDHVRRAVRSLEAKGYIEPIEGGWRIVNFNGDEPVGVARKGPGPKGASGPKRGSKWPERGQRGGPKGARGVARKGPASGRKAKKTQPDTPPLDVRGDVRGDVVDGIAAAPPSGAKPPTVDGVILWHRDDDGSEYLLIDATFRRSVHKHLRQLGERMCSQDKPPCVEPSALELTKPEYDDVLRKLTDICIRDTRIRALETSKESKKRAFKTFCVHRFEEALSYKHQRHARYSSRSPPSRASPVKAEPRGFDMIRNVFGGKDDGK